MFTFNLSVHNNYRVASYMIFNQIVIIHEVVTLGRESYYKELCIVVIHGRGYSRNFVEWFPELL